MRKPFSMQTILGKTVGKPDPVRIGPMTECLPSGSDDVAVWTTPDGSNGSGWGASHALAVGKFHGLGVARKLDYDEEVAARLACKEVYVSGVHTRVENTAVTDAALAALTPAVEVKIEFKKVVVGRSPVVFGRACERVRVRRLVYVDPTV